VSAGSGSAGSWSIGSGTQGQQCQGRVRVRISGGLAMRQWRRPPPAPNFRVKKSAPKC